MEQAHIQDTTGVPLKELRFNAHGFLLKDSLMLMHAQGTKKIFKETFETHNAYLFSQEHLKLDSSDIVFSNDAEGYSINASKFARYQRTIADISQRGIKQFLLGPELTLRQSVGSGGPTHNIDMEVILSQQDIDRVLSPPLYGPQNHIGHLDDETEARLKHETQHLQAMIERGRLPVTYEVDKIVQNDDDVAINRLRRVLKTGVWVSQLAVVSNKMSSDRLASPRYAPFFRRLPSHRPYKEATDIDAYLKKVYGSIVSDDADLASLST